MIDFLLRHKLLVGFFLLVILFSLVFLSFQKSKVSLPIPLGGPTPTPFISNPAQVVGALPSQDQTDVSVFATISATFSRPLEVFEERSVRVALSPQVSGNTSLVWSTDSKTVTFTHTLALSSGTQYTITLTYNNQPTTWSFTTVSIENIPQDQGLNLQSQWDQQWADHQNQIQTDFPWYSQLPLTGQGYFVAFDTSTKTFQVDLHPDSSSPTPQDQQVAQLKKEVFQQLQQIGVDTTKYQFSWNVVTESSG